MGDPHHEAHNGHGLAHDHHHGHDHHHDDQHLGYGIGEPSAFPATLWQIIKIYHLMPVAFCIILLLAFVRLKRRRRAQAAETDYASQHDMNLGIRRARALEAMQQEYDRKAREFEELQAKRRELEAEERAREREKAAASGVGSGGGSGGGFGGGGGSGGGQSDSSWTPLMGSGPVGGFKSQRCVKRGG